MNLPIVVSPSQVAAELGNGLKIVDVRPVDDYKTGHLPGALQLNLATLNRSEKAGDGLLPDQDGVNSLANKIGLNKDDHILAYDQGGASAAARLVWVLHAYGFTKISWLNGGFRAWERASLPTSTATEQAASSNVALSFTPGNLLTADELLEQLNADALNILDVRSTGEFQGTDVRAARGGHIPKALHSEWTNAFNEHGELKSDDELRALFTSLDIQPDKPVLVYCQTHQRSALTYLVLKHLQYQHVTALDGAWSVWGNRRDTPIKNESEG